MPKSKVALVRCSDYDEKRVYDAVKQGMTLLGGARKFAKAGEKLVLKPNILIGSKPESCVTTHPAVFRAVGLVLKEAGAAISYGDSPSFGGFDISAGRAGLKQMGDSLGFAVADFAHGREVSHKEALLIKKFVFANGALDASGIISLSKLKTHALMRLTGAVKNQFGCIPGMLKAQFHAKVPPTDDFATMLVDINTYLRPRLYVMDGITAMEGNGPRNGKPRQMNVLLFSTDPVALDAVACLLIALNPGFVPTSVAGEKAGLGTYRSENIEIVGDDRAPLVVPDFQVVRGRPVPCAGYSCGMFIKNQLTARPVVGRSKCSGCGTCVKVCPVGEKALHWIKSGEKKIPPSRIRSLHSLLLLPGDTPPGGHHHQETGAEHATTMIEENTKNSRG